MASVLFTKFLACSVGMGLFIALITVASPHWSRLFAAKWSVFLWAILGGCLCLPFAPGIPAVEVFFARYPWIPACWLLVAAAVLLCMFLREVHYRKTALRWSADPENTDFVVKAGRLAEELNMKQAPKIRVCARISCPAILGFGEPVLLLPHESYSATEFDIILRHEFYHYLHRHIHYKVFLTVVCALHWFNPAVWWMRQKADVDLECACDDALLADASEKTRRQYTETVLSVMQSPSEADAPFSTHTYGSPTATGRRLVRLLAAPPKTSGAVLLCAAVLISFLSSTAVATATARLEAPSTPVTVPNDSVTVSSEPQAPDPESEPIAAPLPEAEAVSEPEEAPDESSSLVSETASGEDRSEPSEFADESSSETSGSEDAEASEPGDSVSSEGDEETPAEDGVQPAPAPEFPLESAQAVADALPGAMQSLNVYAAQLLGSEGIEGITVPGEKTSGMPSDEILMLIINRVVDAYNNGTADTSMSDPDAPRLMPMPASIEGDLPNVDSSEDFTALPRKSNGYSIAIPLSDAGIQMQIWVDDNGPEDRYEFDVVAVNFARG